MAYERVKTTYTVLWATFLCGKVYYSNTIIITILIYTVIPNSWFENILSPQFSIKISWQNFHVVLREMIENLPFFLVKPVFWIITFIFTVWMHIQNSDITPSTSQDYI